MNGGFYFESLSLDDIAASGNYFPDMDLPGFFDCKIQDGNDVPPYGQVLYTPYETLSPLEGVTTAPADLCEPPAIWDAYRFVEDGALTSISWDTDEKVEGTASVFLDTESGWDVHLHYFPGEDQHAVWTLDEAGTISFSMKINITDPDNLWGVQESFVRLGDACGNYYQYDNANILNDAWGQWATFEIPVSGNADWVRTETGTLNLNAINYISFNVDVWEYGYELWLDGLSVPVLNTDTKHLPEGEAGIRIFPNPAPYAWTVEIESSESGPVRFELYDQLGRFVKTWNKQSLATGSNFIELENAELRSGLYLLKVISEKWEKSLKVAR
jgi:hypothetical protein